MNGSKPCSPLGVERTPKSDADSVRTASVSSPLTPALGSQSRLVGIGERGNPFQRVGRSNRAWFADSLAAILPLPKGEGRGGGTGRRLTPCAGPLQEP